MPPISGEKADDLLGAPIANQMMAVIMIVICLLHSAANLANEQAAKFQFVERSNDFHWE